MQIKLVSSCVVEIMLFALIGVLATISAPGAVHVVSISARQNARTHWTSNGHMNVVKFVSKRETDTLQAVSVIDPKMTAMKRETEFHLSA